MGAWIEIDYIENVSNDFCVAPLVGAWIEIPSSMSEISSCTVAPLVGAWIEIMYIDTKMLLIQSVAPLVGAWIEIMNLPGSRRQQACRSPCGSVD